MDVLGWKHENSFRRNLKWRTEKSHTRASLIANIYNLAREDAGRLSLNTYGGAHGWAWGLGGTLV